MDKRHMMSREESISYESLQSVVKRAQVLIATHENLNSLEDFSIETGESYGSSYATLEYETPETDAEMKQRLDRQASAEKSRREQYERLKKEFEK